MLMRKHRKWADPSTISEKSNTNSQAGAEEGECEGANTLNSRRNGKDKGTD